MIVRLLLVLLPLFLVSSGMAARIYGGYYSRERINNVRANCEKYTWAKQMKKNAVEKAAPWLSKGDETLWRMIPGQNLPRTIDVTYEKFYAGPKFSGCLVCGDSILQWGNYPYDPDFDAEPWKLMCPSCHSVFPTNDFQKYYESAIDEHGLFKPEKGDSTLLFNTNHPDPNDPLHLFGVDDGFGYRAADGRTYKYIGYYSWKYWRHIIDGICFLADGFLFTGDQRYSRKAAILLDRLADVYPSMNWKPYADMGWYHSDGGRGRGKIEGAIWEAQVVQRLADAYDKILSGTVGDKQLYTFLVKKATLYTLPSAKGSRAQFVENVDKNLLQTAYEAVLNGDIRGNQGMHQLTVVTCALALHQQPQTNRWLDWLFEPQGGMIPQLLINHFDHDGTSDEGAPAYSLILGQNMIQVAERLQGYETFPRSNIFDDYPQLKATFSAACKMAVLGKAIPNVGDYGATGLVSNELVSAPFMAKGFALTGDPSLAAAAYRANNNSAQGLGLDIFSKEPEKAHQFIRDIGRRTAKRQSGGMLLSGFGLGRLEVESDLSPVAVAIYYGRTKMHGHRDLLNVDVFAFDQWLTPDFGYPEFATSTPKRREWTSNTISHNTVVVDQRPQSEVWGGYSKLFSRNDGLAVIELDGTPAYPNLNQYTRTVFLVGGKDSLESDSYIVDIFRVKGGSDHVYGFHTPPATVQTTGLELKALRGTYAGENIPKNTPAENFPAGYSFLYDLRRDDSPPSAFTIDWQIKKGYRGLLENVNLRMHAMTPAADITLAKGEPPQNKPGNPPHMEYILMHREGQNLHSTFVTVMEPYRGKSFIQSVTRLDEDSDEQIILRINKINGETDYLLYNGLTEKRMESPAGIVLHGKIGFVNMKNNRLQKAVLINGTALEFDSTRLSSPGPLMGRIVDFQRQVNGDAWILLDVNLSKDIDILGRQIFIETQGERDASYTITGVERAGSYTRVFCGPVSFISGMEASATKRQPEYVYTFRVGAPFTIGSSEVWKMDEQGHFGD